MRKRLQRTFRSWMYLDTYLHLHGTMADQRNVLHGGHVIEATVGATCEMFVRPLPGQVTRARDEKLGINLLQLS